MQKPQPVSRAQSSCVIFFLHFYYEACDFLKAKLLYHKQDFVSLVYLFLILELRSVIITGLIAYLAFEDILGTKHF